MLDARPSTKRTLSELLRSAKARGRPTANRAENQSPAKISLPRFSPGGMPNHINRSSLIAPIGRGQRVFHNRTILQSRVDCTIEYTGEQLDEADGDLLMVLLYFSQDTPLGQPIQLTRSKILSMLRRAKGNTQYKWLLRRIKSMTEATLFIETKPDSQNHYQIGRVRAFHIISNFDYIESTEIYSYTLDPEWVKMFGNREFSLIDWDKRMQIGGQRGQLNIAKALQRLIATDSSRRQAYSIQWLKLKFVYTSPMSDFRTTLLKNTKELMRVGIIKNAAIENSSKGVQQLVLHLLD